MRPILILLQIVVILEGMVDEKCALIPIEQYTIEGATWTIPSMPENKRVRCKYYLLSLLLPRLVRAL